MCLLLRDAPPKQFNLFLKSGTFRNITYRTKLDQRVVMVLMVSITLSISYYKLFINQYNFVGIACQLSMIVQVFSRNRTDNPNFIFYPTHLKEFKTNWMKFYKLMCLCRSTIVVCIFFKLQLLLCLAGKKKWKPSVKACLFHVFAPIQTINEKKTSNSTLHRRKKRGQTHQFIEISPYSETFCYEINNLYQDKRKIAFADKYNIIK